VIDFKGLHSLLEKVQQEKKAELNEAELECMAMMKDLMDDFELKTSSKSLLTNTNFEKLEEDLKKLEKK